MLEPLYQIKITCACCESEFRTSKVRPSFKKAISSDSDFCLHYREDINPDFYVVRVCPLCGFSSTENSAQVLNDGQRKSYLGKVGTQWVQRDFSGQRTWEQALQCYKLALLSAQTIGERDRIIAGLLQHIAWMYRLKEDKEQETRFLRFALESYIRVYEREAQPLNNARLTYLIGELYRRLDEPYFAVKWFSRVIHDRKITDASMIRASREQWQMLRVEMLAKKLELPEEMREP